MHASTVAHLSVESIYLYTQRSLVTPQQLLSTDLCWIELRAREDSCAHRHARCKVTTDARWVTRTTNVVLCLLTSSSASVAWTHRQYLRWRRRARRNIRHTYAGGDAVGRDVIEVWTACDWFLPVLGCIYLARWSVVSCYLTNS